MSDDLGQRHSAFRFHGTWQEFAGIAFPNLLLTIVTLGIYRFWATTREREYLWGKTDFIDERLEWTGRGIELFIGFVMVFLLLGLPLITVQLVNNGLIFRGEVYLVIAINALLFALIFYLTGLAYFRALRYRLSRTYWRGIRGGSDDPGFGYGWSYIWKTGLPYVPGALCLLTSYMAHQLSQTCQEAGLVWWGEYGGYIGVLLLLLGALSVPWSMISLWNERWNAMSFGPHRFVAQAEWKPLMKRYMLFYLIPFILIIGIVAVGLSAKGGDEAELAGSVLTVLMVYAAFLVIALHIILPLAALAFYSKYFRMAVGGLRLHNLEFEFRARAPDWILFFLANMAIIICTLGIGYIFMPYRNWKFFVDHMEAYGEINIDELTQSATIVSKHGEGLLDAFDVGAI